MNCKPEAIVLNLLSNPQTICTMVLGIEPMKKKGLSHEKDHA